MGGRTKSSELGKEMQATWLCAAGSRESRAGQKDVQTERKTWEIETLGTVEGKQSFGQDTVSPEFSTFSCLGISGEPAKVRQT